MSISVYEQDVVRHRATTGRTCGRVTGGGPQKKTIVARTARGGIGIYLFDRHETK